MLKKILSTVLSVSIAGTMLAALPVSAESIDVPITTTIIDENFDSVDIKDVVPAGDFTTKAGDNVYLKRSWGGDASVSTVLNGEKGTDKVLATSITGGNNDLEVAFVPEKSVDISLGDVLHINFDYKTNVQKDADNYNVFIATLGDDTAGDYKTETDKNLNMRFEPINGSFSTEYPGNNNATNCWPSWGHSIARLDNSSGGNGCYLGNGINRWQSTMTDWVNCDIVINTADKTQDGVQTIKLIYTVADGSSKTSYAKFDVNYTGSDDAVYDTLKQFKYLKFSTYAAAGNIAAYFNNVKIEKLSNVKEYYTSAVKHLIDYDFSNAAGFSKEDDSNDNSLWSVDATNNVYFRKSSLWGGKVSGEVVQTDMNGKNVYAFKQSASANDKRDVLNYLIFKNPEGTTKLDEGDIIRFSYDLKNETPTTNVDEWVYHFSPQLNMPRYNYGGWGGDSNTEGNSEYESTYLGTYHEQNKGYNPSYQSGMLLETNGRGLTRYAGGTTLAEEWITESNRNKVLTPNEWHNYEFVINTADKAKDGKQTMKVYIDGTQTFYETLDNVVKDYTKDGENVAADSIDRYDHFTALEMNFLFVNPETTVTPGSIYSTNYKLDIIKPGFGISGNAIKNNDPTNGVTLNPGKMSVTCAVNMPGSSAAKDAVTKKDVTIIAAQYADNQLVKIEPKTVKMSEYENTATFDVEVLDNADSVKLFAFDENYAPLIVNEVGTVKAIETQNIDYSNSFEDAVH